MMAIGAPMRPIAPGSPGGLRRPPLGGDVQLREAPPREVAVLRGVGGEGSVDGEQEHRNSIIGRASRPNPPMLWYGGTGADMSMYRDPAESTAMRSERRIAPLFLDTHELIDAARALGFELRDFIERGEGTPWQLLFESPATTTLLNLVLDSIVDVWYYHIQGPDADTLADALAKHIDVVTPTGLLPRLAINRDVDTLDGALRFAAILARDGDFPALRTSVRACLRHESDVVRRQAMLVLSHANVKDAAVLAQEALATEPSAELRTGLLIIAREFGLEA